MCKEMLGINHCIVSMIMGWYIDNEGAKGGVGSFKMIRVLHGRLGGGECDGPNDYLGQRV